MDPYRELRIGFRALLERSTKQARFFADMAAIACDADEAARGIDRKINDAMSAYAGQPEPLDQSPPQITQGAQEAYTDEFRKSLAREQAKFPPPNPNDPLRIFG